MEKEKLIKKIKVLTREFYALPEGKDEFTLLKIEKLLQEYLLFHPSDIEMWFRMAILEFTPPLRDYERITKYLNNILARDPHNAFAIILLSYAQLVFRGTVKEDIFEKLNSIQNQSNEVQSLIELAKSWYYETNNNTTMQEKHLTNSTLLNDQSVYNYKSLASLYSEQGKIKKAISLLERAIDNVKVICNNQNTNCNDDVTDLYLFFDTSIKQTHISDFSLKNMKDTLKKYLTEDNSHLFN